MSERGDKAYQALYKNSLDYCTNHCPAPDEDRCCVKYSCDRVYKDNASKKVRKLYDARKKIPFMGEHGCLVPPEERPYCTTFVCDIFMDTGPFKAHMNIINRLPLRDRVAAKTSLKNIAKLMAKIPMEKDK